jgi:hypothetical protein
MTTRLLRSLAHLTTLWKARYGGPWNSPTCDAGRARSPSNAARNLNPNQGKLCDMDGGRYTRMRERLMGGTVRRERLGVREGKML